VCSKILEFREQAKQRFYNCLPPSICPRSNFQKAKIKQRNVFYLTKFEYFESVHYIQNFELHENWLENGQKKNFEAVKQKLEGEILKLKDIRDKSPRKKKKEMWQKVLKYRWIRVSYKSRNTVGLFLFKIFRKLEKIALSLEQSPTLA